MMRAARRRGWIVTATLAVPMAAILAFLYARTTAYDESSYLENVALLRQIQQIDARWELDALHSKLGIDADYDVLAARLLELRRLCGELGEALAEEPDAGLEAAGAAFEAAVQEKTSLVEQFKSHHAVLRNSLEFLPTAAADVRQAVQRDKGSDPAARRRLADEVDKLLLATLEYNLSASADKGRQIEADLQRLGPAAKGRLAAIGPGMDILAAHVRAVVREHRVVDQLLGRLAAVPASARIDDINRLLGDAQQRAARKSQLYRRCLLLFSAAVCGLFLYVAFGLIRSHAVIRRVNEELRQANESLEDRVEERTRELRAAQERLVDTARQAGMAEIATNVLHNAGNVLNSVNVSAGLVSRQLQESEAPGLARAVQLMHQHADDLGGFLTLDPKGRLLPAYLGMLADKLAEERQSITDEVGQIAKSIDHIKDIVATQQSYAGAASVAAPVQAKDLVEDALRMNAGALTRHEVTVVREFAEVPELPLDKHRILQILVNLISNAKYAMDGVAGYGHRMTLRVELAGDAPDRALRISVADEGVGIPAENLARIFAHGFTTRAEGHGFGLHSAILAARDMGATLSAHSDGPGRGATFMLEVPVRPYSRGLA